MTATKRVHTLIQVGKSAALIEIASTAIRFVSIKKQQLVSARAAAVAGFEQIIDDERVTVAILLKLHEKIDYKGEGYLNIAFSTEEMKLLRECKAVLQAMSLEPLDRTRTIKLALLRHARSELTKDQHR